MASISRIEPIKSKEGIVFSLVIKGRLGKEDYAEFVPQLEWQIAKDGKINLLVELLDFQGWTLPGLWEDIKFAAKHFNSIERIAVIGRGSREHGITTLAKPLTRAKVRYFRTNQKQAALLWAATSIP